MSPPLPVLTGKVLLNILVKNGFRMLRRKGSHVFVESPDGTRGTVIPLHGKEDLGKGLLRSILNDLELTVEELCEWL